MKEMIEKKYKVDEEKLINAIHQNCLDKQMENNMKRQLQELSLREKIKKEKRTRKIELIALALILVVTLVLFALYDKQQVNNCMENGYSENFCRYAGK